MIRRIQITVLSMKRVILVSMLLLIISSCKPGYTPEEMEYIKSVESQRVENDTYMKDNPNSPFNYKGKVKFHPLKYYDVDPSLKFESKLSEYDQKDTVTIYGTKGEPRKTVRFGYVQFDYAGNNYKLNVYKSNTRDGQFYYSIWFTDKTTNDESYGVGRYINFEKSDDPDHVYTIDFNLAYNPYCAYSKEYSCAMPTKEDYLDLAVEAGEKKFHD